MPHLDSAILLERHQAVFVDIPKVASTSIKTALAPLVGVDLRAASGDPHGVSWPRPSASPASGCLFPGLFSFAFVRNPWDRLVSCYRDKIAGEVAGYTHFTIRAGVANCLAPFAAFRPGMPFAEFVDVVASIPDTEADKHFRSQHAFLRNARGRIAVDYVGRFERLAEDFRSIQERLGIPQVELPRLQRARTPTAYTDFYTADTRRVVAQRYWEDIAAFGYRFDTRTDASAGVESEAKQATTDWGK